MERGYLCLGGIEIVNNCRTMAYIRNVGMPMLRTPPQPERCCCPAIGGTTTARTAQLTIDLDVSDPDQFTFTIDVSTDGSPGDLWRFGPLGALPVDCPMSGRAPYPGMTDPAWVWVPEDEADAASVPLTGSSPYPVGPDSCSYSLGRFRSSLGFVFDVVLYTTHIAPGDIGGSAISIDGGATWVTPGTYTVPLSMGDVYLNPIADDAPWYDPAQPESADFLGVYCEELLTPTPYDRTMRSNQIGVSLEPAMWVPREVHVTGWLYARSLAGAEFGKQWLFEALVDGNCADGCNLPDLELFRTCCSPDAAATELRTLKGVGLVGPPNWNLEPTFPPQAGCKFEFTLQAEQPFMFGAPVSIASGLVYDLMADPECNICSPCSGPADATPCLCGQLTAPERVVTRDGSDDAWCQPASVRRRYVPVPATPLWKSAAAVVSIKAGTVNNALGRQGLANLRLLAFANPLGLTGPVWVDPDDGEHTEDYRTYFVCGEPCMSIEVACLPADSELVIDATNRTATLTCGNVSGSGYPYLSSNNGAAFSWPELDCVGMMVLIEADDLQTPPDTTFEVLSVPRDRV